MSAWNQLVSKFFKDGRAKNPSYKLKNAMQDAAKVYKKGSSASPTESTGKPTKKCRSLRKRAAKACGTKRRRKGSRK
jgi:hypothetical protein